MKIKSLHLRNDELYGDYYFTDTTVIISPHNKAGKTTLLRCLLYALGYPIPSMRGMALERMELAVHVQTDEGLSCKLTRQANILIFETEGRSIRYSLPSDLTHLHSVVFGIQDPVVLDNLLGAFYIDQDKGWTLLNRGKPIGGIHFSIEDFLRALGNDSCDDERKRLDVVEEEIQKYRYMLKVAEYQVKLSESGDVIPFDSPEETIMRDVALLRNERKPLEKELQRLHAIDRDNMHFKTFIGAMQLRVKAPNGEEIPVTEENVIGFQDVSKLVKERIKNIVFQVSDINIKIHKLEARLQESNVLFNVESQIQSFARELQSVSIDQAAVERILKQLNEQRKTLTERLKEAFVRRGSPAEDLSQLVMSYLREFNLDESIGSNVFTNELQPLSGTILHLVVFSFKISYVKLVFERTGCALPLIIDSPHGREVEASHVAKMMEILHRDFSNHQIILATLFDLPIPNKSIITLSNGILHSDLLPE